MEKVLALVLFACIASSATGLNFADPPQDIRASVGDAVLLRCIADQSVTKCKWSWRPLNELGATEVVVKEFPSFGNESQECSVRFRSVRAEQEGLWTCSIRDSDHSDFIASQPASLHLRPLGVEFLELPQDTEATVGDPVLLRCVAETEVEQCQWTWRPLQQPNEAEIVVKKFPSFGNESRDCSIRFRKVLAEQEGLWACGVRRPEENKFHTTPPAKLHLRPAGVKFVQLSQDLQVALGEPVLLRCVVSDEVEECQWSWRPLEEENGTEIVVKKFLPFGNGSRDCSVRFRSVLPEQEGLWTCGVLKTGETEFKKAPPATLNLLPPVKMRFIKSPQSQEVEEGEAVNFHCVTTAEVEKCQWNWRPLGQPNATAIKVKEFPAFGNGSRNCSVEFQTVVADQEGLWTCGVQGSQETRFLEAPPAALTVLPAEDIQFVELSQDLQVTVGKPVVLRCVASVEVRKCQWTWHPLNDSTAKEIVVREFPPFGNESRDCSVKFRSIMSEQEGVWTCNVRGTKKTDYLAAPSAKLSLLDQGSDQDYNATAVFVAHSTGWRGSPAVFVLWPNPPLEGPDNHVTLACRLSQTAASCRWVDPSGASITIDNSTNKYSVQLNGTTGICTINFRFQDVDLGKWRCLFTVTTKSGEIEVEGATLVTLADDPDKPQIHMGWILIALFALVLLLTVMLVLVCVCKKRQQAVTVGEALESALRDRDPKLSIGGDKKDRYTDSPTKIKFNFGDETNGGKLPGDHIYESLGRSSSMTTADRILLGKKILETNDDDNSPPVKSKTDLDLPPNKQKDSLPPKHRRSTKLPSPPPPPLPQEDGYIAPKRSTCSLEDEQTDNNLDESSSGMQNDTIEQNPESAKPEEESRSQNETEKIGTSESDNNSIVSEAGTDSSDQKRSESNENEYVTPDASKRLYENL